MTTILKTRRTRAAHTCFALTISLLGTTLSGCSEYFDHREGIRLSAGDAIAANRVAQVVDPWSPASRNKNIAYDGQKMQSAAERYRENKVIPPGGAKTSSSGYTSAPAAAPVAAGKP
jgi:hypothetical protein